MNRHFLKLISSSSYQISLNCGAPHSGDTQSQVRCFLSGGCGGGADHHLLRTQRNCSTRPHQPWGPFMPMKPVVALIYIPSLSSFAVPLLLPCSFHSENHMCISNLYCNDEIAVNILKVTLKKGRRNLLECVPPTLSWQSQVVYS